MKALLIALYLLTQPAQAKVPNVVATGVKDFVIRFATFTNGGSCAEENDPGAWIASVADPGAGSCTITIATGSFSTLYGCICNASLNLGVEKYDCSASVASVTEISTHTYVGTTGADVDRAFQVACFGLR